MPILKREPDLYPAEIFELGSGQPWWVAQVRSRQEKMLSRELRRLEVPFFLPLREQKVVRRGRQQVSFPPLFPGYLFFKGNGSERMRAIATGFVSRTIHVLDQEQIGMELRQIGELGRLGLPLVPHPYLGPGDLISVVSGPFHGYRGHVLRAKGLTRLIISIELLRKSIRVEFDREALVPFEPIRAFSEPGRRSAAA